MKFLFSLALLTSLLSSPLALGQKHLCSDDSECPGDAYCEKGQCLCDPVDPDCIQQDR